MGGSPCRETRTATRLRLPPQGVNTVAPTWLSSVVDSDSFSPPRIDSSTGDSMGCFCMELFGSRPRRLTGTPKAGGRGASCPASEGGVLTGSGDGAGAADAGGAAAVTAVTAVSLGELGFGDHLGGPFGIAKREEVGVQGELPCDLPREGDELAVITTWVR